MSLPRRTFLASTSAAFAASCASTQTPAPQSPKARAIHALVEAEAGRQRLAGTQYFVSHRGEVVAEGAFGSANLDCATPVSPDTLFLIASITKLMTSVAALRLADRGVFDLDAPVQTYIGDFPTHPEGVATPMMLIDHTAGIRHYNRAAGEPTRDMLGTHYDTATAALAVFRDNAYAAAPNTRGLYSSYGYALLAACMEGATGKSFTQILNEEIFAPAGMVRASVPDMRYPIAGLAHSYSWFRLITGEPVETLLRARENDFSYNCGGGNIIANARSVAAFGAAMLQPGLLVPARWTDLVAAPWTMDGEIADGANYARDGGGRFGWPTWHDRSNRRVLHGSGASEAYQGGLSIYPDDALVICALSNTWGVGSRDGGFTLTMHVNIADIVLAA